MSKFKVGDTVIVTTCYLEEYRQIFQIVGTRPNRHTPDLTVYQSENMKDWDEEDLELYEIWNSPLYQALRE